MPLSPLLHLWPDSNSHERTEQHTVPYTSCEFNGLILKHSISFFHCRCCPVHCIICVFDVRTWALVANCMWWLLRNERLEEQWCVCSLSVSECHGIILVGFRSFICSFSVFKHHFSPFCLFSDSLLISNFYVILNTTPFKSPLSYF